MPSNIDLSDSDSDDDAFLKELGPSLSSSSSSFRKRRGRQSDAAAQQQQQQQKKMEAMAMLDESVEYGEKQLREQQRYHQLKIEESSKQNVLTQAESIVATANNTSFQQSRAAKRRQTNDAILGIVSSPEALVKHDVTSVRGDLEYAKEEEDEQEHDEEYYKRRKAQAHATMTGRTTLLGVRTTLLLGGDEPTTSTGTAQPQQRQPPKLSFSLAVNQDSSNNNNNNKDPFLQELQHILTQITSFRHKPWTMALVKPLQAAMKEHCLNEFLDMCVLVKHCEKYHVTQIPSSLMIWLYQVACSCSTSRVTTNKSSSSSSSSSSSALTLTGNTRRPKKAVAAPTPKLSPTFQQCAFETLLALWDNGIVAEQSQQPQQQQPQQQPLLVLEEMVPQLEQWYGLQPLGGKEDKENQKIHEGKAGHTHETEHEKDAKPTPQYSTYNVGLKHYLHLWSLALLKGYVVLPSSEDNMGQVATECLVALSRVGIDVTFQSGRSLLSPLGSVLHSILHVVSTSYETKDHAAQEWKDWMIHTVTQILKQRPHLGHGDSENEDDGEAWLSMSLMVRLFPTHHVKDSSKIHTPSLEFRTMMALESLKQCLDIQKEEEDDTMKDKDDTTNGKSDDFWDNHAKSVLKDSGNESLMKLYNSETATSTAKSSSSMDGWKAIISAYVGIFSVELVGDKVATDGPRCMATVESAALCAEGGMNLVSLRKDSPHQGDEPTEETPTTTPPPLLVTSATATAVANGGLYQSVQNADTMCHILDLLEHQARQLMKRIKQYQIQPHFQRCMYYLSCLQTFYRYCKEEASRMAGRRESVTPRMGGNTSHTGAGGRQTSMDSFFGASGVHPSDDDDDKSEDEGNEENKPNE